MSTGRMRRLLAVVAVTLAVSFAMGSVAQASTEWCEDDPIITVDGRRFEMVTGVPWANASDVKGPVLYEVVVPRGSKVTVEYPPARIPSKVVLRYWLAPVAADEEMTVRVTVTVRSNEDFPTRTRVFGRQVADPFTVYGEANEPRTFKVTLQPVR